MKFSTQCLVTVALWGFSLMAPACLVAESPPAGGCEEAVALLKSQNDKLTGDLRRIQREIAALRADLDYRHLCATMAYHNIAFCN